MEKDFNKWLISKPNWSEIAFEYNTGKKYQHKQDLVAVFWNSYIYFQQKAESYFNEFGVLPYEVLNELKFEFKQNFSEKGRLEGVNYFDDLIGQLISKYDKSKIESEPFNKNEDILELTEANLIKCGLDVKYFNSDSKEDTDFGDFIISYTDNKIYPLIFKYKQSYKGNETPRFPFRVLDLIEDYYKCKLNIYLKQRENLLGSSFVKLAETEKFKQSEVKHCEQVINYYSDLFKNAPHILNNHSAVIGKEAYKTWLEFYVEPKELTNHKDGINTLSSREIAIRHYLLVKAKEVKQLTNVQFANEYTHLKDYDNLRKALPKIETKGREDKPLGNNDQLRNVRNSLTNYPSIQKSIDNMLD